jgi:hypothetical protein
MTAAINVTRTRELEITQLTFGVRNPPGGQVT